MAQVKIFGLATALNSIKAALSETIHSCVVEALQIPADKKFHRFFPLAESDFSYPPDRSEKYTIIEITMFEWRSNAAKKKLVQLLFAQIYANHGIAAQDIEITIFETPKVNWGIRGQAGDELGLNYKVEV